MSLLTGGLGWDLAQFSAGQRSKRFSLLAVDGEVRAFNLMETPENATSDAATLHARAGSGSDAAQRFGPAREAG